MAATYAISENETKSNKYKFSTKAWSTNNYTIVILNKSCFVGSWQARIGVVSGDKQQDRRDGCTHAGQQAGGQKDLAWVPV